MITYPANFAMDRQAGGYVVTFPTFDTAPPKAKHYQAAWPALPACLVACQKPRSPR